jgi:hypothetical protein
VPERWVTEVVGTGRGLHYNMIKTAEGSDELRFGVPQ